MVYYYLLSLVFYIQKFLQAFQNIRTDGSTKDVPEMSEYRIVNCGVQPAVSEDVHSCK
jgi:hypothetical protein